MALGQPARLPGPRISEGSGDHRSHRGRRHGRSCGRRSRRECWRRRPLMALRPGLIALAVLGLFGAARAEENPRPLRQDSRIRTVTYEHDNVVVLNGALGVSTMIMFGDDETI